MTKTDLTESSFGFAQIALGRWRPRPRQSAARILIFLESCG